MFLKTKLMNQLKCIATTKSINLSYDINNIVVNGIKRGCSGFVTNNDTGSCVYINTEKSCYQPLKDKCLYRYAKDNKDYSSNSLKNGQNKFCEDKLLAQNIVNLLLNGAGIPV